MTLRMPVDPSRDHILGPTNARVSLVEYGDFECPYCGRAYFEVHQVLRRMRGQVQFVFRHFPLSDMHPHALLAAEAAEAAGAQGKFWEMYSLLFENQRYLEYRDLLGYARDLELDMREFRAALEDHRFLPRVREDFASGVRSGVNGTPCFFINGQRHDAPWDADTLMAALRRAATYDADRLAW
ncbi:MAG: Na+/H+ antiporter NhaA [Myxococcales bacterium]|nr:Na+/H+ antiporter NhaA [Myxococcales bacterium]